MRSLDRCQPRCFLERVIVTGLCFLSGTVLGLGSQMWHDSDDHSPLYPSAERAFCLGLFSGEFP